MENDHLYFYCKVRKTVFKKGKCVILNPTIFWKLKEKLNTALVILLWGFYLCNYSKTVSNAHINMAKLRHLTSANFMLSSTVLATKSLGYYKAYVQLNYFICLIINLCVVSFHRVQKCTVKWKDNKMLHLTSHKFNLKSIQ